MLIPLKPKQLIAITSLLIGLNVIGQNNRNVVPDNQKDLHLFKDYLKTVKADEQPFASQRFSEIPLGRYDKVFYDGLRTNDLNENIYEKVEKNSTENSLNNLFFIIVGGIIVFVLVNSKKIRKNIIDFYSVENNSNKKTLEANILQQLSELFELKTQGAITEQEFEILKEKLLKSSS